MMKKTFLAFGFAAVLCIPSYAAEVPNADHVGEKNYACPVDRKWVSDELIRSWAMSHDRWWRRAALVSTVVLNTPSHGCHGDSPRTLAICELLVDDRDDMVVKAMSWALRKLVTHDEHALRSFMAQHDGQLAARVVREVNNKLSTGLENPKRT